MASLSLTLDDGTVINATLSAQSERQIATKFAPKKRRIMVGDYLNHKTGIEYQLIQIKTDSSSESKSKSHRAYLINEDTGIARNSRKVVYVKFDGDAGYVTELPAEKDCFYDPKARNGSYLDM